MYGTNGMGMMGGMQSFGDLRKGMMGSNPMADGGGYTSFGAGGGMDAMGTLSKHSGMGAQYANRGGFSSPMTGGYGMGSVGGAFG